MINEKSMKMPAEKPKDCSDITDITYSKQEKQVFGNQQAIVGY